MHGRFVTRGASWMGLLAIVLFASGAGAQQQVTALITAMAANANQLRQYTFKQRTETYHKGELKNTKLDEIHYSASGERVSIPLGEQKAEPEAPRRGPGHRVIAKKIQEEKEKMKDYVERLVSLTGRYVAPDPARLQAAIPNAEVITGGGGSEVRIRMRDYVRPGDSMIMSFDAATKRPTKTEVNTSLDDSVVNIILAFDQIREGPSYLGRTVITSGAKELQIRVLTYDYRL